MTHMPKRQKTLLGYFTLSDSGNTNPCLGGHVCQAQAQESITRATTAGIETVHTSTSNHALLAASMSNGPLAAQLDHQDGALPVKGKLVIGPARQMEMNAVECSGNASGCSQSNTAVQSTECDAASEDDDNEVNQYEQQVR